MAVADQISVVLIVRLIRVSIIVAEVGMFVVDRLLANLEEVVRVELQSTHLLTVRKVMSLVLEVVIIMLGMRCVSQEFCNILSQLSGLICSKHVLLTWVATPVLLFIGKLIVFV